MLNEARVEKIHKVKRVEVLPDMEHIYLDSTNLIVPKNKFFEGQLVVVIRGSLPVKDDLITPTMNRKVFDKDGSQIQIKVLAIKNDGDDVNQYGVFVPYSKSEDCEIYTTTPHFVEFPNFVENMDVTDILYPETNQIRTAIRENFPIYWLLDGENYGKDKWTTQVFGIEAKVYCAYSDGLWCVLVDASGTRGFSTLKEAKQFAERKIYNKIEGKISEMLKTAMCIENSSVTLFNMLMRLMK